MNQNHLNFLPQIQEKGWTLKSLGIRWSLSERQMSRLTETKEKRYMDAIHGLPSRVELKVNKHPSGRLTLMIKEPESKIFSDCKEPGLFANLDETEFNRCLSIFHYELENKGLEIDLKKCDRLFIPMNDTSSLYMWIKRWAKNKEDDSEIQEQAELLTTNAINAIGLVYDTEQFGPLSFENFQFILGSDGIGVSKDYFTQIPEKTKRIND
ncbi:hypothetical protein [Psychromonas sp. Urea-02u-13]|uniref:hypothetical protein n=1 Tax=Psychromonas sp. Urea-02u-13 TaxID=2058326 RepID=UPI000C321327|nr:hypothetical protein [Psychromonas sp. Urea-02u-13]PKG37083.1 hypothetical protein CXF74_20770 [Psychromonas sp. Urea-02u-13]